MEETFYLVGVLKKSHPLDVLGNRHELPLIFSDGMVGCCPVFDNIEDANKYAGDKFPMFAITLHDIREEE